MSRKKGIAVLLPALALMAAATQIPAASAAVRTMNAAAAAPSPGTGGQQGPGEQNPGHNHGQTPNPGDPGQQDPGQQDPNQPDPNQPDPGQQDPGQQDPNQPDPGQQDPGQQDPGQQPPQQQPPAPPVQQGPKAEDYVNIRQVPPNVQGQQRGRGGSRGTFTSRCGRNENNHHNPDNYIVAPGVRNGAHHLHDYVGNVSTDGFSTDETLAAAGTTCRLGDKSVYFWPVLRLRDQDDNSDSAEQSQADGNVGRIVRPAAVTLQFRGNARSRVAAMPRFLRMVTGDAKSLTNGPANARAQWTCTGFTNRVTTKYPLCPRGSQVTRILDMPSCWDGRNVDSVNHRTHVLFPDQAGNCPQGTRAIPQLRMMLSYNVPARALAFALDSFPEQLHSPITDHGDFENVMPNQLMRMTVFCINGGRRC